ncbi:MAG TPA: NAD-dependent succinate-semialdehyde dehydrogenase [Anaerolineae bacterium]|nr:NAD-dependent succinate-semialdehyde dehydrogenase [Anaerolineae bacterium]
MDRVDLQLFIDGEWRAGESGETFEVINPANGQPVGTAAKGGCVDAQRALEAASQALVGWRQTTGDERARRLKQAADAILARRDELAVILTSEHGKPLADARKEISGTAATFEYYGEEARRISGDIAPPRSATARSLVVRQPVGVVAAIAPWNYPVSLMAWKVGPALAAGCTVVVKPPTNAPLAATLVAATVGESGLPDGALNVVTGPSSVVGEELVTNPITRMVAFTGSTETGRHLMRAAADDLKRLILELGGHTPMVVFKDADLERAVADGVKRSFRNMGQICNAVNRIYVEEEIAVEYTERFVELTGRLTMGDGLANPDVDLGPMTDLEGIKRTQRHVDDALAKGARLLCGGKRPDAPELRKGFFYEATVLVDASPEMLVMHEESFGPIVGIATFKGIEEAIGLANSTPYGLVTYGYTRDLATAFAFGEGVESGTVAINTVSPDSLYAPYPAWKHSGMGMELSHYGLEEYLQVKHILVDIG